MKPMKRVVMVAMLGLGVLLVACGGGGGSAPPQPNPGGSNPPALNIVKIGDSDGLGEFLRTAANARGDVIAVWRRQPTFIRAFGNLGGGVSPHNGMGGGPEGASAIIGGL